MPSQTKENYLKALYHLAQRDERISVTELSKQLEVSPPTANHMVRKLQEHGWLTYKKYKPIQLTDEGRHEAAMIVRKHRLAEMFLTQVMGLGWEEVHDIAEELEHVNSQRFFDRMDEMLDEPRFDPHGSPIPDKDGSVDDLDLHPLSQGQLGGHYELQALQHSSEGLLRYLNDRQLGIGSVLALVSKTEFDGSAVVKTAHHEALSLSQKVVDCLMVRMLKKDERNQT